MENQTPENATTTETSETEARRKAAAAALNAISAALHGPRGEKKAAREAEKAKRAAERKAHVLQVLTTGDTGRKDEIWNARMALVKAVSAVKNGATASDLQACTALQAVAPWATLVEPVTQFAEAKGADSNVLVAGLCGAPAAAPEVEAPAPTAAPQAAPKASVRRGRKGA